MTLRGEDLDVDNTSLIKKNAAIAKAQADRDVAIAQAEAESSSNETRVLSDTEIAQKNNELAIMRAELQTISDTKKAQTDAAHKIQEQEQQKSIETATVNAQIVRGERDAELKKQEVEIAKQTLNVERYKQEQEAQASLYKRQKEAETKKFEMRQETEAKRVQAEAARFATEQEAEGIKAAGIAEAEGIRVKAMAEGEDIDRKAEAMKKYGDAAVIEMVMCAAGHRLKRGGAPAQGGPHHNVWRGKQHKASAGYRQWNNADHRRLYAGHGHRREIPACRSDRRENRLRQAGVG